MFGGGGGDVCEARLECVGGGVEVGPERRGQAVFDEIRLVNKGFRVEGSGTREHLAVGQIALESELFRDAVDGVNHRFGRARDRGHVIAKLHTRVLLFTELLGGFTEPGLLRGTLFIGFIDQNGQFSEHCGRNTRKIGGVLRPEGRYPDLHLETSSVCGVHTVMWAPEIELYIGELILRGHNTRF